MLWFLLLPSAAGCVSVTWPTPGGLGLRTRWLGILSQMFWKGTMGPLVKAEASRPERVLWEVGPVGKQSEARGFKSIS